MGQSVTRINDRSAVPGTGGIYDRPMIGVGREGGSEQAPSPETAGVPNPHPIRRKQTLVDQQHPASIPKPNETATNVSDEQKGFRGRLRRGWLTTIGVFQRKHDNTTSGSGAGTSSSTKKDNNDSITTSPKSAAASPTVTGSASSSSPSTPKGTPVRARTQSSPAMTGHHVHTPPVTAAAGSTIAPSSTSTSTGVISPRAIRPRSESMPAQVPSLLNDDNDNMSNDKPVTHHNTAGVAAAAPHTKSVGDITTSPRGGIHQTSTGSGSGTGGDGSGSGASHMQQWWRQHHGALEHMMPPRYAAGNTAFDELHRESRDPTYQPSNPSYEQHEPNSPSISKGGMVGSFDEAIPPTTMKPHRNVGASGGMQSKKRSASPNRASGNDANNWAIGTGSDIISNPQQRVAERGNLNDRRSKGMKHNNDVSGLPPMLSPWNTQPDELHREPPMHGWRGQQGNKNKSNSNGNSNDGNVYGNINKGVASQQSQQQQQQHVHHVWPPGQASLHNNDSHTQPGGWPMNP